MSEHSDIPRDLEGQARGEAGFEDEAERLLSLSPSERMTRLSELARSEGVLAVPLLEELASRRPEIASDVVPVFGLVADATAASALERIASTSSGEARKAARRELHRLASRGVRPAAPPAVAADTPQRSRSADPVAFASPIDGSGNRGIWFGFKRGGDVDFVSVLIDDQAGIKDLFAREMATGRFDRETRKVLGDEDFPWIEIPANYARHVIESAHKMNAKSGTALPIEYLALRDRVARPTEPVEQPIVYSVISAASVRWDPRYLDNSERLYESSLFQGWILDKDEIAEYVNEKISAERTGLVLAGVTGERRDEMIAEKAIQKLFDARKRSLYRGRLEEMAYLLWRLERFEMAKSALAAGLALEPPDRPLTDHPFVNKMVRWSIEVVSEMARGERLRSVKPGVQLHLPY